MKNILILLILFSLSCTSNKRIVAFKEIQTDSIVDIFLDTNIIIVDKEDFYESVVMAEPKIVKTNSTPPRTELGQIQNKNNESTNAITNFPIGKVAYSIPDTMDFYREYIAVLRITKNTYDSSITVGLGNDSVVIEGVRVSSIMSAALINMSTDTNFSIRAFSSKNQNIDDYGYTEWKWGIKPLKSGYRSLRMVIKVVVDGSTKDIPVFEKDIYIHSRPEKSIGNFFANYWQWIIGTLLLPLLKWLWDKKQKEKVEKWKT